MTLDVKSWLQQYPDMYNHLYGVYRDWIKVNGGGSTLGFTSFRLNGVDYDESHSLVFTRSSEGTIIQNVVPLLIVEMTDREARFKQMQRYQYEIRQADIREKIAELERNLKHATETLMWYETQIDQLNDTI